MKVLVTGGAGFIGSRLVALLSQRGYETVVFDDLSTGYVENLAGFSDVRLVEGDVRNAEALAKAMHGCQMVFHLAASIGNVNSLRNPVEDSTVNVLGTLNVLEAAREAGVKRVVFASSSSVYGDTEILPKVETMTPSPRSPYAASKLAAESYCRAFHAMSAVETVVLRYFNVFGPRQSPESQYAAVVPRFAAPLVAA